MKKQDVSLVIINYNSLAPLTKCLKSIEEPELDLKIFILDNDSGDGPLEHLRELVSHQLFFHYSDENIGFTAGCNKAFQLLKDKHGTPSYVFFLNPDTVLQKNSILKLLESLKENKADLVYPKSVFENGKPYASGIHFDMKKMRHNNHFYKDAKFPVFSDFYQGSAFLIKGEVYEKVGGMDEKLFMYYDEADLSFRLKKAGYKILYNPNVTITHNASYTLKKFHHLKAYYLARNGLFIFLKYNPNKSFSSYLRLIYHHVFVVLFIWYPRLGYFKSIRYAFKGYKHYFQNRFGKLAH